VFDAIYELNYHISMKKIIFRKIASDCLNFFCLTIFTISTIIWVLQAVNYLDFIIEDGHGFFVYFNYTLLSFPKIISKIYPYALFLSISYILLKYENNNELVIFWNFGINKIRFVNFFIKLSFGFVILNLILNSVITPYSQDKARSFIRGSDLDLFESILKPKKFIDIVKNLTIYFDEKKENGDLKNIFLKDNVGTSDFQITFAKKGVLEIRDDRKVMVLHDGKTINNINGKISEFKFAKTDFNISKFNSTTTTSTKTQENSTKELFGCLIILKKIKEKDIKSNFDKPYNFNNCRLSNLENIYSILYQRLIKPFYSTLLIMIALLLILKSKDDHTFTKYKLKIYIFGFLFIIFIEYSSKFITTSVLNNFFISTLPILLLILLYSYFQTKLKIKKQ
jgi:lipopolysaccharide export system permease protein